jgi:hypothetical protein
MRRFISASVQATPSLPHHVRMNDTAAGLVGALLGASIAGGSTFWMQRRRERREARAARLVVEVELDEADETVRAIERANGWPPGGAKSGQIRGQPIARPWFSTRPISPSRSWPGRTYSWDGWNGAWPLVHETSSKPMARFFERSPRVSRPRELPCGGGEEHGSRLGSQRHPDESAGASPPASDARGG